MLCGIGANGSFVVRSSSNRSSGGGRVGEVTGKVGCSSSTSRRSRPSSAQLPTKPGEATTVIHRSNLSSEVKGASVNRDRSLVSKVDGSSQSQQTEIKSRGKQLYR